MWVTIGIVPDKAFPTAMAIGCDEPQLDRPSDWMNVRPWAFTGR